MTQQTIHYLIVWSAIVLIAGIIAAANVACKWAWAFRAKWSAPAIEADLRKKLVAEMGLAQHMVLPSADWTVQPAEPVQAREEARDVPG